MITNVAVHVSCLLCSCPR